MLPLHRIRAIIAAIVADLPGESAFLTPGEVATRAEAIVAAASDVAALREIGRSRGGAPLRALRIGRDGPSVLVVGVPRGDAPLGALTILALARALATDTALREALGVVWWLVPCADQDGAEANAGWYAPPFTIERYARAVVPPPAAGRDGAVGAALLPEMAALQGLIAEVRPRTILSLHDVPAGGAALFERHIANVEVGAWRGRATDFARLLDPLGLPLDRGGALGPAAAALAPGVYPLDAPATTAYGRFRAGLDLAGVGATPGDRAIVAPRFLDYDRRERDPTPMGRSRREVAGEGVQLWREWFAFGRTALDLVAPAIARAGLAGGVEARALAGALRGGDAILAGGLRWPDEFPEWPATIAEGFAEGDAIRIARLPRVAALLRLLDAARDRLGDAAPDELLAARDRADETRDRWLDDLAGGADFRPARLDRAIGAQLGALLLALPDRGA